MSIRICKRCGCTHFRKLRRHVWMHLIPFSICWECRDCYSKYLTLFGITIWRNYYV